jgi:D-glycero-beta-D-manno-heptose-7-phosphate kinase
VRESRSVNPASSAVPARTPSVDRLIELVGAFAGRPVVMLVDLVADRFITGVPKRISREAPVLILRYEGESLAPGGGANAAANVRSLGGRPLPYGCVGDDADGRDLLDALAARGIPIDGVVTLPGWRTPTKTRILAGFQSSNKQQVVRFDREPLAPLAAEDRIRILRHVADGVAAAAEPPGVAILSDYGYGAVGPELVAPVRAALGPEALLLADSRFHLGEYRGLDGATPNEEEAEALVGERLDGATEELESAGQALRSRLDCRFLLVTRGSQGMSLFEPTGGAHVPVHGSAQVADVTGAGDTVIGTFALALAAGATPLEATLLANFAGGVVVMKMGTATLESDELVAAIESGRHLLEEIRWAK